MTADGRPGVGGLTVTMLIIVVAGTPLVAFAWETLNRLLAGVVEPARLALTVPVAALLAALLGWVGRLVRRWQEDPRPEVRP